MVKQVQTKKNVLQEQEKLMENAQFKIFANNISALNSDLNSFPGRAAAAEPQRRLVVRLLVVFETKPSFCRNKRLSLWRPNTDVTSVTSKTGTKIQSVASPTKRKKNSSVCCFVLFIFYLQNSAGKLKKSPSWKVHRIYFLKRFCVQHSEVRQVSSETISPHFLSSSLVLIFRR